MGGFISIHSLTDASAKFAAPYQLHTSLPQSHTCTHARTRTQQGRQCAVCVCGFGFAQRRLKQEDHFPCRHSGLFPVSSVVFYAAQVSVQRGQRGRKKREREAVTSCKDSSGPYLSK